MHPNPPFRGRLKGSLRAGAQTPSSHDTTFAPVGPQELNSGVDPCCQPLRAQVRGSGAQKVRILCEPCPVVAPLLRGTWGSGGEHTYQGRVALFSLPNVRFLLSTMLWGRTTQLLLPTVDFGRTFPFNLDF